MNWRKPSPRGPSRFRSGTRAPWKESSRVSDARQPSFCIGGEITYPSVPFGTIRFETSSSPVRAVIVTQAEMSVPAFVMKIFAPSITHSPSSSRAVVRVAPESEPASGSVRPNAASRLPEARSGSHCRFCSSLPKSQIGSVPERVVRGDRDRDGRVDARQLLDRDRVRDGVGAAAAVLLRDRHPHQPELGQLGHQLVGEAVLAVELLRDRRDLLLGELADGVADELVLRLEVEVHAESLEASSTIIRTP